MISYRITKYNPKFRNSSGAYQKNDWTSISDIGKIFEGKKLTKQEYLKIENAYIQGIIAFMDSLHIASLCISYLENDGTIPKSRKISCSKAMLETYKNLEVGKQLDKEEITDIARLALRELLWCKLENERMFIHFGYDYYMYIGSSKIAPDFLIKKIQDEDLFVEEFKSPYLEDDKE